MSLGELITQLVDLDLSDPNLHDRDIWIEQTDDDQWWIVIR